MRACVEIVFSANCKSDSLVDHLLCWWRGTRESVCLYLKRRRNVGGRVMGMGQSQWGRVDRVERARRWFWMGSEVKETVDI